MSQLNVIAEAISSGFKLLHSLLESSERRRFDACKEAAEKYIFTNEDSSLDEQRRNKLLKHYKKRFFHYN